MKNLAFIAALGLAAPVMAADVGLSVNIGQPGFYGQINIGNAPAPQVIYSQPVVIAPQPAYVGAPIYLHVHPGDEEDWAEHCGAYNACGRPVYFVREDWYVREYVPRHHHHGDDQGEDEHHGHDDD